MISKRILAPFFGWCGWKMFPDLTGPKLLVTKKTATLKVLTKINLRQKNGRDSLAQGGLLGSRDMDQIKLYVCKLLRFTYFQEKSAEIKEVRDHLYITYGCFF